MVLRGFRHVGSCCATDRSWSGWLPRVCREASLRGAEVHAVHVREEQCHSLASYAVPPLSADDEVSIVIGDLVRTVQADQAPGVPVRAEEVDGLAARVLLDRCAGADML